MAKGWRRTKCKNGHDRTDPTNLYWWGGYAFCKACRGRQNKEWHQTAISEKSESYRFRKFEKALMLKYGLTVDQYHSMLENQDFVCKICDNEAELVVDHNHITGKVRGLLCSNCNRGIGLLKENSEALRKAAVYCEVG